MYKSCRKFAAPFSLKKENPFKSLINSFEAGGKTHKYFGISQLNDPRLDNLPFSIRVLLESAIRNCDQFEVKSSDVENILNWEKKAKEQIEIPFKPARVILQDFTGVPVVVDLAAIRDAVASFGGNPKKINPLCPVDLVIDHSVQADVSRIKDAYVQNEEIEFKRNEQRFEFLKWGSNAFENFSIVPPGSGIVHQVNLEYLARVVMEDKGFIFPDSVVGTDSHTTMINGLGVVGWGVGGIEAEAVMLGQPISMVLPEVIGFRFTGKLRDHVTATDLVLTVTKMLRKKGVVGKFVQFFGPGAATLTLSDRATVGNMAPEYGATIGYFPPDVETMRYLAITNRSPQRLQVIEKGLKVQKLFKDYNAKETIKFTDLLQLNLNEVEPSISGPKRPHDHIPLSKLKEDWTACTTAKNGFKGFGLAPETVNDVHKFNFKGKDYELRNGSVVISAITSCTNTSNPGVMMGAGLLAKKAVERGLKVQPYIKTTLSPGSGVVTQYLNKSGLTKYLDELGFTTAGYGCMTCIGNSGDLDKEVADIITTTDLVGCAVISGNRNFEGRVHPLVKGNYLASPLLVVAFALAGRVDIDITTQSLGTGKDGKPVYLKDIWPSEKQIKDTIEKTIDSKMFAQVYSTIMSGNKRWNNLAVTPSFQYKWKDNSTYIHNPPFLHNLAKQPEALKDIEKAYVLAYFGDSITTDHISPAGNIAKNSPAARFLEEKGVESKDYNTYGARRGNDEVMARGTFANTRIINKISPSVGPKTTYIPTGEVLDISDAAYKYKENGHPSIILAGNQYGSGSSRDWAAKGPYLLGVKAIIAQSFERIHRSNLIGMGILPLEFAKGESAESLGLTGKETFTIPLSTSNLKTDQRINVKTDTGKEFECKSRLDTDVEIEYFKHGGILQYVTRKLVAEQA